MSKRRSPQKVTDRTVSRLQWRLYLVAALIALLGLADGIYLTVEHLTGHTAECIASAGCQEVLGSKYATIGPIPLAGLGAFAYFAAFSAAILAAFGYKAFGKLLTLIVGMMFGTTLWLLYLQAFVIRAFCDYCLVSAALTCILAGLVIAKSLVPKDSGS